MNTILAVSAALSIAFATPAAAQSGDDLRRQIAELKTRIEGPVTQRIEDPGTVVLSVSVFPIIRLFDQITAKPAAQRTASFTLTGATGQLVSWGYDCHIWGRKYGSVAAFAEFRSVAGGHVATTLRKLAASWNAPTGILTLVTDVDAHAFVPMIRTYLDLTCIGGGSEGPNIGPISADLQARSTTPVAFTRGSQQLFQLQASVDVNATLDLNISLGSVGSLRIPFGHSQKIDWTGELGGPTLLEGQLELPQSLPAKRFSIDLGSRTIGAWSNGYRASVTPAISWK